MWKRMMVTMQALTKCDKRNLGQIVALHRQTTDVPALMTTPMCKVPDRPMSNQGNCNAQTYPPQKPRPTTREKQNDGKRQLLRHPRGLKEAVKPISAHLRLQSEFRGVCQLIPATQLPKSVFKKWCIMTGMRRALSLPLMPIPHVMRAHHAKRPSHADQHAQINQYVFKPQRGFKRPMN
ncbi:MAG: hypothetical protein GY767_00005 [Shimia sp.]|nr:hypothetical protein [Shimia sp.]